MGVRPRLRTFSGLVGPANLGIGFAVDRGEDAVTAVDTDADGADPGEDAAEVASRAVFEQEPDTPVEALRQQVAALESRVDELVAAAGREQERAAFRESVIDRLHAENQTLRRGELDAMFQPVRDGVVAL